MNITLLPKLIRTSQKLAGVAERKAVKVAVFDKYSAKNLKYCDTDNSKARRIIEELNSYQGNFYKKLAGVQESKAVKVADNVNLDKYSDKYLKYCDTNNSKARRIIEELNSYQGNLGKRLAGVVKRKAVKVAVFDKWLVENLKNLDIKNFVKANIDSIKKK